MSKQIDLLKGLPDKILTPEEEAAAVATKDYEKLILASMRGAFFYVRQCCRGQIPDGEIYSLCYLALTKSAPRFRLPSSTDYFGFSKADLRGEIKRYWKKQDVVKNSSSHESLEAFNCGAADSAERWLSGSEDEVIQRKNLDPFDPLETLFVEPEFDRIDLSERMTRLQPYLDRLTEREREIIQKRIFEDMEFREIGKLIGTSHQYAQKTFDQAIKKLRLFLGSQKI